MQKGVQLDIVQVMDDQPVSELSVRIRSSDQKMPADCIRVKPGNDYSRSFVQCTKLWSFHLLARHFSTLLLTLRRG